MRVQVCFLFLFTMQMPSKPSSLSNIIVAIYSLKSTNHTMLGSPVDTVNFQGLAHSADDTHICVLKQVVTLSLNAF